MKKVLSKKTKNDCTEDYCNEEPSDAEKKQSIEKALYERAVGFSQEDVAEEFGIVENELRLLKRKTSKKYYPPEIRAIEMMIERDESQDEYSNMNLNELESERNRLIELIEKAEKNDKEN